MKQKVFCLKIGGSVITDKSIPYKAKKDTIRSIAKSLKEIKSPIVISHGVGSYAHTSAKKYGGGKGYTSRWGIAKVAHDAHEINRIVMDIFLDVGLPVISFSPRNILLTDNGKVDKLFFDPLREALLQRLIPVIHGDVIWDISQKTTIFSGETSLHLIAQYLQRNGYPIAKIIQLSNVDGVLDSENNIIPEITNANWHEIKSNINAMTVADVTGGMRHKVEEALMMTRYGVETLLLNGNTVNLPELFAGKHLQGTIIR
jgi:isopentenyl phosphate kinase